jgi:hypothetical protein
MLGSSRVAAQLAASREGLGSMSDNNNNNNKRNIDYEIRMLRK